MEPAARHVPRKHRIKLPPVKRFKPAFLERLANPLQPLNGFGFEGALAVNTSGPRGSSGSAVMSYLALGVRQRQRLTNPVRLNYSQLLVSSLLLLLLSVPVIPPASAERMQIIISPALPLLHLPLRGKSGRFIRPAGTSASFCFTSEVKETK